MLFRCLLILRLNWNDTHLSFRSGLAFSVQPQLARALSNHSCLTLSSASLIDEVLIYHSECTEVPSSSFSLFSFDRKARGALPEPGGARILTPPAPPGSCWLLLALLATFLGVTPIRERVLMVAL